MHVAALQVRPWHHQPQLDLQLLVLELLVISQLAALRSSGLTGACPRHHQPQLDLHKARACTERPPRPVLALLALLVQKYKY